MKITIEQYGSSIVALSVFVLLLGLCMWMLEKNGIFTQSAIEHTVKESYQTGAFDEYRNKKLPEIFAHNEYEIKTGEYIPVSSCFYGKDKEGSLLSVKVTQILDEKEDVIGTIVREGMEYFYFEESGTYELVLETQDKSGKRQTAYVKIFVNESLGSL